jgi:hypothetical protein
MSLAAWSEGSGVCGYVGAYVKTKDGMGGEGADVPSRRSGLYGCVDGQEDMTEDW